MPGLGQSHQSTGHGEPTVIAGGRSVVGGQFHQPAQLHARHGENGDSREGPYPRIGTDKDQMVVPVQVRQFMAQHRLTLLFVQDA